MLSPFKGIKVWLKAQSSQSGPHGALLVLTFWRAASWPHASQRDVGRRSTLLPIRRQGSSRPVGLILLGLGVALLCGYAAIGDWAYYPLLISPILAAGGTLARYGITTIHWILLIHGGDRMFLVPTTWHPNNTTLLVPLDGEVRVQFQFRNGPP
jgi:hypothetical protein